MSHHVHRVAHHLSTIGCDVCTCGARRPVGFGSLWEARPVPEPRVTPPMPAHQLRRLVHTLVHTIPTKEPT